MGDQTRVAPTASLEYQPALDGVRAVAVAMVLCFHAGFDWMAGGYFGVSIFFTLSGFLITSLLINEHDRTGRIALGTFAARRAKRLLPASLMCLTVVSVARLGGQFDQAAGLRGELLGAATHMFNWVKLGGDSSYTDVFAGSAVFVSPLEHYWSLAIEEQFYLVWPLAVLLLSRRIRRWSIALPMMFVAAAVLTPAAALVLDDDATYWATPMRFGELLAGAALAGVLRRWAVPAWAGRLGLPIAAALVALAVVLPTSSGPAYAGLFAPLAIVSAFLLWSLQVPGAARRLLANRALVGLGSISYGVYLFHWPVFVWLRQQGWTLTEPWRFVVASAVTVAVAVASYLVVERPVRAASWPTRTTISGAIGAMVVAVVAISALPFSRGFLEADTELLASAAAAPVDSLEPLAPVPTSGVPSSPAGDRAESATTVARRNVDANIGADSARQHGIVVDGGLDLLADLATMSFDDVTAMAFGGGPDVAEVSDTAAVDVTPFELDVPLGAPLSRPVRVLTIGDSTAFYLGQALAEWAVEHPEHATSDLVWCQACGFVRGGEVTSWDNSSLVEDNDEMLDVEVPAVVGRIQPDVAVLMVTVVDVADRQWSLDEGPLTPSDDRYRERLTASYRRVVLDLIDNGVGRVAIVKPPRSVGFVSEDVVFAADRWDALHAALDDVADELGPQVSTLDLASWAEVAGVSESIDWRPDGTHLTSATAFEVVERWLGPTLLGVAT